MEKPRPDHPAGASPCARQLRGTTHGVSGDRAHCSPCRLPSVFASCPAAARSRRRWRAARRRRRGRHGWRGRSRPGARGRPRRCPRGTAAGQVAVTVATDGDRGGGALGDGAVDRHAVDRAPQPLVVAVVVLPVADLDDGDALGAERVDERGRGHGRCHGLSRNEEGPGRMARGPEGACGWWSEVMPTN